jgi:hypothetical protein
MVHDVQKSEQAFGILAVTMVSLFPIIPLWS